MREGEEHRSPGEGPSTTVRQGNGITVERWCVHGRPHRDPNEGAAIAIRDVEKSSVREEFRDGERMQSHPGAQVKTEANADG
jgi:hypothetical protein